MSAGGRSRAAALALLAGVVMVIGAVVVVPAALYWSKQGTAIRDARSKVLRAEDRVEAQDNLARSQDAWKTFAEGEKSGFSLAPSDDSAVAEAEARIGAVFKTLNASAPTITGEAADSGREGVRRVILEVRGSIPRKSISAFLGALESTSPYVMMERFEAKSETAERLRVSFRASVYRLVEDAS